MQMNNFLGGTQGFGVRACFGWNQSLKKFDRLPTSPTPLKESKVNFKKLNNCLILLTLNVCLNYNTIYIIVINIIILIKFLYNFLKKHIVCVFLCFTLKMTQRQSEPILGGVKSRKPDMESELEGLPLRSPGVTVIRLDQARPCIITAFQLLYLQPNPIIRPTYPN